MVVLAPTLTSAQLDSGVIGYYPLDSDFLDGSGNDAHGTFAGTNATPSFMAGQVGNGIDLDGVDQRVVLGAPGGGSVTPYWDPPTGDISISIWVQTPGLSRNWQAITIKGEGNAWRLARRAGNNGVGYAGGVGDIPGAAEADAAPINDMNFHHIFAVTEGGVETRIFVDGTQTGTGGVPNLEMGVNVAPMIGGNPDDAGGSYRSWIGILDEAIYWDRPLKDHEVAAVLALGTAGTAFSEVLAGTDDDSDGLPNWWEVVYGTDPADDGSIDPENGPNGDTDSDGATNFQEFMAGSDANSTDTDNDLVSDGDEINGSLNPWVDGDPPVAMGTPPGDPSDPCSTDTDGDGLDDNEELTAGTDGFMTNPAAADSDGDGLLDPVDPDPETFTADPDGDGLDSVDEESGALNPWVGGVNTGLFPGETTDPRQSRLGRRWSARWR